MTRDRYRFHYHYQDRYRHDALIHLTPLERAVIQVVNEVVVVGTEHG